jgi:DNA-binding CsgD family transcriptional regulator
MSSKNYLSETLRQVYEKRRKNSNKKKTERFIPFVRMDSCLQHLRVLHGFAEAFSQHPRTLLCFSFYKLWLFLIFAEGFRFLPNWDFSGVNIPAGLALMFGLTLFFLLVAICFKQANTFFKRKGLLFAVALIMSMGAFFFFLWSRSGHFEFETQVVFCIAAVLLCSVGTGVLHVECGRFMGYLGMRKTLLYGQICLLISVVLYSICHYLAGDFIWVVIICLPIPTTLLLKHEMYANPYKHVNNEDRAVGRHIPARFLLTSLTQGLAFGALTGFLVFDFAFLEPFRIEIVGVLVAIVLSFVITLFMQPDFNRLIYQVGFCLVSGGMLLSSISKEMIVLAIVLQVAGFFYLDLILWALGSFFISNRNQSATWLSSIVPAALMLGRSIGLLLGCIVAQGFVLSGSVSPAISVAAFAVLLVSLYLSNNTNIKYGWGLIKPGEENIFEACLEACRLLARDNGLTEREEELLFLFAQGKDRRSIADQMFITPNTIKTHTHNIYVKLGVHSREDLIRRVRDQEKAFASVTDAIIMPLGD